MSLFKKKEKSREDFYKALIHLFRDMRAQELVSLLAIDELSEYGKGVRDSCKKDIDFIDNMINPSTQVNFADSKQNY